MKNLLASILIFFSMIVSTQASATIINWVSHQSSLNGQGLVATVITLDQIPVDTGGVTTEFGTYYRIWLGDYQHTPTEGQTYGRIIFDILDGEIKSTRALFGGPLELATRPSPTNWGLSDNVGPYIDLWPFVIFENGVSPGNLTGPREWNGEILSVAADSGYWVIAEIPPSYVPEPSTMLLLGSGLVGLVGYGRRRMKKQQST